MPLDDTIADLDAVELRDRLAGGAIKAGDLADACIRRVSERDGAVGAFAWFDPEFVASQARAMDRYRESGRPLGPLHGLPVAIKDVIDTAHIPTENGTVIDRGRVPEADAAVIEKLKAAGAIIFGKTVTTELAFMHPSPTRNPVDTSHTPGGSSAGSAAAVAAGMVPLSIGTQTGGSVIRPAAFCGVTGYKPSFGAISRRGILTQSQTLDTVGVMARSVEGAALVAEALFGHDDRDPATATAPHPRLLDLAQSEPPVAPTFAFVKTPFWDRADEATRQAFDELAELLGERCFEADLPGIFAEAAGMRTLINQVEMAKNYRSYLRRGEEALSATIKEFMAAGASTLAQDYLSALDWPEVFHSGLAEILDRCDAIVTPAAPGPAPASLETTGDPVFNGLWTLCGVPAVTIPVLEAENGMPMGVQLIGKRGQDGRLLRTANWLARMLSSTR